MAIDESDLAARLMEDMDAQLLDFLKTKVNSFVKWDLVRFFHENPNTADTPDNVARYAGRDPAITAYLASFGRNGVPLYVWYPRSGAPQVLPQVLTEGMVLAALAAVNPIEPN